MPVVPGEEDPGRTAGCAGNTEVELDVLRLLAGLEADDRLGLAFDSDVDVHRLGVTVLERDVDDDLAIDALGTCRLVGVPCACRSVVAEDGDDDGSDGDAGDRDGSSADSLAGLDDFEHNCSLVGNWWDGCCCGYETRPRA